MYGLRHFYANLSANPGLDDFPLQLSQQHRSPHQPLPHNMQISPAELPPRFQRLLILFLLLSTSIGLALLIVRPSIAQQTSEPPTPEVLPESPDDILELSPDLPDVPATFPEPAERVDGAPQNPLELTEPDPLLPTLVIERPLSPQERSILDASLNELNQQAQAAFQAGDLAGAFELWNRELRLRRYLGVEAEADSLSRVGEIAWRENQVTEVRVITQRLEDIQQEVEARSPVDYDLLLRIAQAYQSMRARDQAATLYGTLLVQARQEQNLNRERQILQALGEMHLAWFDYPNASDAYQQLLVLAQAQSDIELEIFTLQQLSRIYQDNRQPEEAIVVQQRLVDIYQGRQEFDQISALKQLIGDEYLAIDRPDLAATNYQEAFAIARSTQQYAYAGDALQRLANLYVTLDRLEDALVVYQLLLDVRQQSYDDFGIMNTHDQVGQIHRAMGNPGQAVSSFRRALEIAQRLNYKVAYFNTQIEELQAQ
jgi:tetratricopeptide (TPR) repeat protein